MSDGINKGDMLGKAGVAKATGGFKPDLLRFQEPLEGPNSVAYSFCTGCGTVLELTHTGVEQFTALIGRLPDDLSDIYFQTASCSCCYGTDQTVSIRKINQCG